MLRNQLLVVQKPFHWEGVIQNGSKKPSLQNLLRISKLLHKEEPLEKVENTIVSEK